MDKMLINLILTAIFCHVTGYTYETEKPFLLKLTPEQVMQTFDGVMSNDYIKILAKDFATKAAAHFMNEIRNQKKVLIEKLNNQHKEKQDRIISQEQKTYEAEIERSNEIADKSSQSYLDEREAFRLLQAPSPDGDHLDSSEELSDKEENKIPVIQLSKINGKYYRRLLGML